VKIFGRTRCTKAPRGQAQPITEPNYRHDTFIWLRGAHLNRRPQGYEPCELPGCSTPHSGSKSVRRIERSFKDMFLAAIGMNRITIRHAVIVNRRLKKRAACAALSVCDPCAAVLCGTRREQGGRPALACQSRFSSFGHRMLLQANDVLRRLFGHAIARPQRSAPC
jgi:hypothetical protein